MKVIMHWIANTDGRTQLVDASNAPVSECDDVSCHPETYFEVVEL